MSQLANAETTIHGLYASAPQELPFAPGVGIRAFVLRRDLGNLLIYSVAAPVFDAGEELGKISRHYLGHSHEAMFATELPTAPLFVHENERDSVAGKLHVRGTFSRGHMLDDDFEVIPIPGHTPGATAYLWDSGGHRMLFTGDSLYLDEGEWVAAVLDSSDRDSYVESLELLRELDFDVLVPWAATAGQPYFAITDSEDAGRRIGAILERVRAGEDR